MARTRDAVPQPAHLLSALSRLSVYVTCLGEQEEALLLAVAPHVGVEYNADDFFKDLDRLVDNSPRCCMSPSRGSAERIQSGL